MKKELAKMHDFLVKKEDPFKYGILSEIPKDSEMIKDLRHSLSIFREFIPVKPESNRKLSKNKDQSFDIFNDSLFDYPTIIAHYLNDDNWENYNFCASLHSPLCNSNCWPQ